MFLVALVRAIHIAATLLVAGAAAFELLVLRSALVPSDAKDVAQLTRKRLQHASLVAAGAGLLSWCAWLAEVALGMSGLAWRDALQWSVLDTVVTQTTFGEVWAVRAALWIVVLLLLARRARPATRAAVALALAVSLAWTGHAVGAQPLHLVADAVHLAGAALWLGMLPPLAWLTWRASRTRDAQWTTLAAAAARRFSMPGMVAVVLLTVTGVANAWWLLESYRDLFVTGYGQQLLGKLVAFAAMLVLAAANRMVLVPRIDAASGPQERRCAVEWLRRSVFAEALLGAAVLAIVGSLGVTPPTGSRHRMHQEMSGSHHAGVEADSMSLRKRRYSSRVISPRA
jgi:copper resistance protein D